jgi:hypothetical protein
MRCLIAVIPGLVTAAAAGETCSFNIYNHTACTANPYNSTRGTLSACCEACQDDNQCGGFTLHSPDTRTGVGSCLLSLPEGTTTPNYNKPGITCGTRAPLPPPPSPGPKGPTPAPSPPIPAAFDCGIRRLALEYGAKLVAAMPAANLALWEALQLGPACSDPAPPPAMPPVFSPPAAAASENDVWVSPTGDDSASGESASSAWRTLARAARWLALTPAAQRPPTTVHLLPGTYALDSTLSLGPEHSGASAAAPVRWVAERGADAAPVVLSGGVDLSELSWAPSAAATAAAAVAASAAGDGQAPVAVWEAHVGPALWPASSPPMQSLFAGSGAGEQRQWKARWPNGNPETYCARDLHGGNGCVGFAQASATQVTHPTACAKAVCGANGGVANVHIHSAESGALIAEGTMEPYDAVHNFSVATPGEAFHTRPQTFSTFQAFAQPQAAAAAAAAVVDTKSFQLERFDTSVTAAFWNTAVPSEMYVTPAAGCRAPPNHLSPTSTYSCTHSPLLQLVFTHSFTCCTPGMPAAGRRAPGRTRT